jgi:hypothetical protein
MDNPDLQEFKHGTAQRFQGVNREGEVAFFEDFVRVELAPFDHGDGRGPVSELGTVKGHLGGENVPVYIDGKNNPSVLHDYTSTPLGCIVRSWAPEELDEEDE